MVTDGTVYQTVLDNIYIYSNTTLSVHTFITLFNSSHDLQDHGPYIMTIFVV